MTHAHLRPNPGGKPDPLRVFHKGDATDCDRPELGPIVIDDKLGHIVDTHAERPGKKRVVLQGRGYPTAEAAVAALRGALLKDGIEVADEDIVARTWTDKRVICPWEAVAWIPDEG